jgi:phosphoribosylaminoimidazole (AIR) synthetase
MYSTFNCGIGFVLAVPPKEAADILKMLKTKAAIIGRVVKGEGKITIKSAFDSCIISL